jgi:hypothetical protein
MHGASWAARVAALQVVRVVRADDRSADRLRDAQGFGHDPFLLRDAVGLTSMK